MERRGEAAGEGEASAEGEAAEFGGRAAPAWSGCYARDEEGGGGVGDDGVSGYERDVARDG